jgi:CheY-like chemotaxis protein
LTRQLLAFSRKQIFRTKVLNLNAVISDMEKMLHRLIGEDIELKTIRSQELGNVEVDQSQVEQVIMNLMINGRDAMPQGGKLTIETANVDLDESYTCKHRTVKPGRYVMMAISDNGIGMDEETQSRIFEPFFTTKELGKGTGLGLSTVYGIVKQSGGNIWIYSESGKGTTFKIYLPRVDKTAAQVEQVKGPKKSLNGSETILVVEDNDMVRQLALKVFLKYGYMVLEAKNGEEAVEICRQHEGPIHLMLADVVMPKMGGRKLAEHFENTRTETKVLYMSGYADDTIVHHGILPQGMNFVQKPFTHEMIASKVRELLDER